MRQGFVLDEAVPHKVIPHKVIPREVVVQDSLIPYDIITYEVIQWCAVLTVQVAPCRSGTCGLQPARLGRQDLEHDLESCQIRIEAAPLQKWVTEVHQMP